MHFSEPCSRSPVEASNANEDGSPFPGEKPSLQDLVGLPALSGMQAAFIGATGLQSTIVDDRGKRITRFPRGMANRVCRMVLSTEEGDRRCQVSDHRAGIHAAKMGKPYVYSCHAGLVDVAELEASKGACQQLGVSLAKAG